MVNLRRTVAARCLYLGSRMHLLYLSRLWDHRCQRRMLPARRRQYCSVLGLRSQMEPGTLPQATSLQPVVSLQVVVVAVPPSQAVLGA